MIFLILVLARKIDLVHFRNAMSKTTTTKKPATALARAITAKNLADLCVKQVCLIKADMEDLHARNMISFVASCIAVAFSIVAILTTWLHR